jgi:hypothetical protein
LYEIAGQFNDNLRKYGKELGIFESRSEARMGPYIRKWNERFPDD